MSEFFEDFQMLNALRADKEYWEGVDDMARKTRQLWVQEFEAPGENICEGITLIQEVMSAMTYGRGCWDGVDATQFVLKLGQIRGQIRSGYNLTLAGLVDIRRWVGENIENLDGQIQEVSDRMFMLDKIPEELREG